MEQVFTFVKNIKGTNDTTGKPYNMIVLSDGIDTLPPLGNPKNLDCSSFVEREEKVAVVVRISARTTRDKTTNSSRVTLNADVESITKAKKIAM